ncbi:MAG: hypothetical protein JWN70_7026, partial [Planctomycetaceae bacterium]|nr:hypothetical protein [Planctomycetaceae bacterium]
LLGPVLGMNIRRDLGSSVGPDLGGILGMSFLRDYVVNLDQEQGTVTLTRRLNRIIGKPIAIRPTRLGGVPRVVLDIPGIGPQPFLIDTGFVGAFHGDLSPPVLKALLARRSADIVRSNWVSRKDAQKTELTACDIIQVGDFEIGQFNYRNLEFMESSRNILGIRFWSRDNVIFDFPRKVMYIRRTDLRSQKKRWEKDQPMVHSPNSRL